MSEGKKVLLIIVVFILVLGSIYFFMANSFNNQSDELEQKIKNETEQKKSLEQELSYYNEKLSNKDINNYYNYLPSIKGIPQLLVGIDNIAYNSNIIILNMNFEENTLNTDAKENDEKASTINIVMTVGGSYLQIRDFIDELYESERLISLKEYQWAIDDSQPNYVIADLYIETYYYPQVDGIINDLELIETYELNNDRIDPTQ